LWKLFLGTTNIRHTHTFLSFSTHKAFEYFNAEPDQALMVQTSDNRCFVAFRGTSLTIEDWSQNLEIGTEDVCINVAGKEKCCTSRVGFYDAYDTPYRKDVEDRIRQCASLCQDRDDCVIITGHSQGGAIAVVAAVILADLNPYVITFGQPPTLDTPCDLLTTQRIFRYVNTIQTNLGIAYDPVPMAPGLGADHFGNMIVLGDDPTGVAFIGLDAREYLEPYLNGIEAHYMTGNGTHPGYADRIGALTQSNATYPIRNNVRMVTGSFSVATKTTNVL
jgi:pimeloyl-ACP methyl ester carboxylesterase